MTRIYNKMGLTLVEVLLSTVLLSVIFLMTFALYTASQRFYTTANNKIIISYELQHAIDHIYKNAMQAMGDKNSAPIEVPDAETLYININNNDPLSQSNYSGITTYTYSKSDNELMFNDGSSSEPLTPKIDVTSVNFSLDGNLLTISLTGSYGDESLTFYSACYPRLASFQ